LYSLLTTVIIKIQSRWSWLAYSAKKDGAFCKACVAFVKSTAGINNQGFSKMQI